MLKHWIMYSSEDLELFDKWVQQKNAIILSSEEFSCKRVQNQTCLSYAECSRKSLVCKMYVIVNK